MPVKNNIRSLRKERGITGSELARRIGVEAHTLRRWERGEVQPPSHTAAAIASFFNVTLEVVLGMEERNEGKGIGRPTIPVFGRAEGGSGIVNFDQPPIDHIEKPGYLDAVDNCYALMVVGDSMEPRFFAGEILIVNPFRAPRAGDFVVVQYRRNGDIMAIAKRFVRHTANALTVHELNPDQDIEIAAADVVAVHYVASVRAV